MLRRSYVLTSIAFALSTLGATDDASAAQRTFVASFGLTTNTAFNCSIAKPCRAFTEALSVTSYGGEVIVLDSAGYGIATITQAVSIIAPPGVYAGISVSAGNNGVNVSAGPADTVVLRGLTINGQGGNNGIRVTSGDVTHIEDCTIANMQALGIRIDGGTVHMARLVIRGNGTGGVRVTPSAATLITTTLVDSTLTNNGGSGFIATTLIAGSTANAAISRVTSSRNASAGFSASSNGPTETATMTVADSIAAENLYGVVATGDAATAIVSGSTLVRNSIADLSQDFSARLRTAENNAVTGRPGGGDIIGTLTANPLK